MGYRRVENQNRRATRGRIRRALKTLVIQGTHVPVHDCELRPEGTTSENRTLAYYTVGKQRFRWQSTHSWLKRRTGNSCQMVFCTNKLTLGYVMSDGDIHLVIMLSVPNHVALYINQVTMSNCLHFKNYAPECYTSLNKPQLIMLKNAQECFRVLPCLYY